MFFQIAFTFICIAVATHLSTHLWRLTVARREKAEMDRLRSIVDWTAPPKRKKKFWKVGR